MQTITVDDQWFETARLFGDVEQIVSQALQAYLIQQSQVELDKASQKISDYQHKYKCDYQQFNQAIQTDARFLQTVEKENPLWEEDAMEWLYWLEEQQTWQDRLQAILKR